LEVSVAVRPIYGSLGVKRLIVCDLETSTMRRRPRPALDCNATEKYYSLMNYVPN